MLSKPTVHVKLTQALFCKNSVQCKICLNRSHLAQELKLSPPPRSLQFLRLLSCSLVRRELLWRPLASSSYISPVYMTAFRSHDSMLQCRRRRSQYASSTLLVLPYIQRSVRKEQYIFLGYHPQYNTRIVHSLWMPDFSENNVVVSYCFPFTQLTNPETSRLYACKLQKALNWSLL